MSKMVIVSACLAGVECRYDCASKINQKIIELVEQGKAIPVCPEQLGGLPTPRTPAERLNQKVITKLGDDITSNYENGAEEVIKLIKLCEIDEVYLKDKSPMCGVSEIYNGTFSGKTVKGQGVLTEKLIKMNIKINKVE